MIRTVFILITILLSVAIICFCEAEVLQPVSTDGSAPQKDPNAPHQRRENASQLLLQDPNHPIPKDPNSNSERDVLELPSNALLPDLYKACNTVFNRYVKDNGDVDYSLLRRKRADLYNAMKILENAHPAQIMALDTKEKQAFWLNTYNLCTLKLIIENYPIQTKWYMILYPNNSIMQIADPWTKNFFEIQGLQYNLQEIEQELLMLDRHRDPRLCFALSNASRGSGFLRKEAYQADILDNQLNEQTKRFILSDRGMTIDKTKNTLNLSNVFNMYRDVFLKSEYADIKKFRQRNDDERAWLNFLSIFISDADKTYLENSNVEIKFIKYDWELNDSPL